MVCNRSNYNAGYTRATAGAEQCIVCNYVNQTLKLYKMNDLVLQNRKKLQSLPNNRQEETLH